MSLAKSIRRPATYEDLLALPEHLVGEIIAGQLEVSPRPSSAHALACGALHVDLGKSLRGGGPDDPKGWWILFEPELHLGADVLVPDLAAWRKARMPVMPRVAFFELAPDWVCEVVSPGRVAHDRVRKLPRYADHGVGHAWIVDPVARTLEVYRRTEAGFALVAGHEGTETVRAEPFEATELRLDQWWIPDEPSPEAPLE